MDANHLAVAASMVGMLSFAWLSVWLVRHARRSTPRRQSRPSEPVAAVRQPLPTAAQAQLRHPPTGAYAKLASDESNRKRRVGAPTPEVKSGMKPGGKSVVKPGVKPEATPRVKPEATPEPEPSTEELPVFAGGVLGSQPAAALPAPARTVVVDAAAMVAGQRKSSDRGYRTQVLKPSEFAGGRRPDLRDD